MTPEQDRILQLIDKLPRHDGHLPIEDHNKDGMPCMGAHGAANAYEAKLAGILKAYAVSDRFRAIAGGVEAEKNLRETARIVTSFDGAESARTPEETKALADKKINDLDLSEPLKQLVRRVIAYSVAQSPDAMEASGLVADIRSPKTQELLKSESTAKVFDEGIRDAALAKFYQITDTSLFNQSSVRLGHVPGRPSHSGLQQTADRHSDDEEQRQNAIAAFIRNLKDAPTMRDKEIHIFDVGHGDGKTAAAAIRAIRSIRPGAEIHYSGIDLLSKTRGSDGLTLGEHARKALEEAGVAPANITLSAGTFGLPARAESLRKQFGTMDLVIASHLYNTKQPEDFFAQIESLQKPDGIAYEMHEGRKSWAKELSARHQDLLRPDPADKATILRHHLDNAHRDYASFESTTTDRITPMTEQELQDLKQLKQGVFEGSYPAEPGAQERRNLLDYYLRAPVEAFSATDRAALLDDFQEVLKKGGLTRTSEAHAVLSLKNKNQELSQAVHQAAEATQKELLGPGRFIGTKQGRSITQ